MKNITDLRGELCEVFETLKESPPNRESVFKARELNNSAGKIMATCRLELSYAKMLNRKPSVPFLR